MNSPSRSTAGAAQSDAVDAVGFTSRIDGAAATAGHTIEWGADARLVLEDATQPSHARAGRRGWLMRRMLLAADLVALLAAFAIDEAIFGRRGRIGVGTQWAIFLATLPGWIVAAKVYGLYDRDERRPDHSTADEIPSIIHMVTVIVWLFFALSWISGLTNPNQGKLAAFWALTIFGIAACRVVSRYAVRRRPGYAQRALIVGAGDVGQLLAWKLLKHPEYGIDLVGFVDTTPKERRDDLGDLAIVGSLDRARDVVHDLGVERVIVAFSEESHEEMLEVIRSFKDANVHIDVVPRLFEVIGPGMNINSIEGVSVVSLPPFRLSRSSRLLKRTLDLAVAFAALVVLAPVLALVAVAIKLDSEGSVLFRQRRMGSGDRMFFIYKFRTMVREADAQKAALLSLNKHAKGDSRMFKIPGDPRITRVGRLLRRYSIDELPQLVNVLKGEMSLVGPRPLVLDEDSFVEAWARQRLALRPGMTGVWQILGRTDIPFSEMVKLDYVYVMNWTLAGDLKILARTFPAILRAQDAY